MNPIAANETSPGSPRAQSTHPMKWSRIVRNFAYGVAAFGLATTSPLHAGELSAMTGESIDVGRFHGVVYYTAENDGYRVVATIADDSTGSPLRFSATLAENQSATLSVAGNLGEPVQNLKIFRSGGKIFLVDDEVVSGTNPGTRDIAQ